MPGAAAMALPLWLLLAGGALCFLFGLGAGACLSRARRHGRPAERTGHQGVDLTQALQIQLQEALGGLKAARRRADEAERANQAKSSFLATMSHELRTPLSTIIGFAEMIEQQAMGPIGNGKYSDYAADIRESGQHLLGIINDILDLSKVEAGKESLHEQDIPFDALLTGVRILVESRAREAGVRLAIDCPPDLPAIRADKRRLTQILVNLLSNGIKFTPEGGTVTLRCRAAPDGLTLQAIDTGIGMAPEDIPVALAVFGQVRNGAKPDVRGTGLGLPLAKALTELHGGKLEVQSALGEGTTVSLQLPAHRVLPDHTVAATPRAVAG